MRTRVTAQVTHEVQAQQEALAAILTRRAGICSHSLLLRGAAGGGWRAVRVLLQPPPPKKQTGTLPAWAGALHFLMFWGAASLSQEHCGRDPD
jgi:hypothetical protein